MPSYLDEAFRPKRFEEEVRPELSLTSALRKAAARQPLYVSAGDLTSGYRGPDLGRLANVQTGQASQLSSALGRVVAQEQGRQVQDEIEARRAFMAARMAEQERLNAGAEGLARELSTIGGQAIQGAVAAGQVATPEGELDADAQRNLRLRRLQAFGSAFGGA